MIRPLVVLALVSLLAAPAARAAVPVAVRVGDLTVRPGEVPRRIVGYGIVTGLDGTGDRNYGTASAGTPSVRSIVNLLRRFDVEVPQERLRPRDVAAVVVTAEISPWLRAGGRFEVQVSAIGDATSLRGGVLWITPMVTDPSQPAVATAQGPVFVGSGESARGVVASNRHGNSGRIAQGGLLETDLPVPESAARLLLRQPDLVTAQRIAESIDAAFGAGRARVDDPGAVTLTVEGASTDTLYRFLAAVDTLWVNAGSPARIVIDGHEGTIVAGGDVRVAATVVSHGGITLQIGGTATPQSSGLVRVEGGAAVEDVASALHAAGAAAGDIAAVFEALHAAGALHAEVTVR
jgi:flagellar P-ring protein precursor FlgI